MSSPVRQLLELISSSISTLEKTCAENGTQIPDLDAPFSPSSEAFRTNVVAAEAANIVSAAALQLAAILTPPQVSLYHIIGGHFRSAAIRVCIESNVTEILREAGPQGLHVEDIAAKNGQDPDKLARFLRFLATNHVYREVSPNVFANTRISSILDTLKPSEEIIADPVHKHDNTPGLAAFASHHLDEAFKAAAYAWETLADPATRRSGDPSASPFARAFNTKQTLWQFHERAEESYRNHRFGVGMQGVQAMQPVNAILDAYNWASLPAESIVVDVGGGVGTSSFPLAEKFSTLKIVVQDLPGVVKHGKKVWEVKMPDKLKSGAAHDFFDRQPQTNASVFLLKQITHDWSDEYCVKFLTRLRTAATPTTILLIVDSIMPFACHDPSGDDDKGIPGAVPREAPAPLLANFGAVNEMAYNADIDMFLLFNSQERTIRHFDRLLRSTGWKIKIVHRQADDSTFLQSIEAIPIV
ncbi:hypothetical protein EW146_g9170 [Bondarzewia mesenterica]|uniref:Uncharacterized protein n=1 Tax=Bondarzewia mesenterica TaxID=1095465 RepID=A0A4S4LE06_9AGAM|nr:hypothetical protein EW146_g9170 [Bondarzewia mesenterica]